MESSREGQVGTGSCDDEKKKSELSELSGRECLKSAEALIASANSLRDLRRIKPLLLRASQDQVGANVDDRAKALFHLGTRIGVRMAFRKILRLARHSWRVRQVSAIA